MFFIVSVSETQLRLCSVVNRVRIEAKIFILNFYSVAKRCRSKGRMRSMTSRLSLLLLRHILTISTVIFPNYRGVTTRRTTISSAAPCVALSPDLLRHVLGSFAVGCSTFASGRRSWLQSQWRCAKDSNLHTYFSFKALPWPVNTTDKVKSTFDAESCWVNGHPRGDGWATKAKKYFNTIKILYFKF